MHKPSIAATGVARLRAANVSAVTRIAKKRKKAPGTLISRDARRWLTGLLLCQAMSCFSIAATGRLQLLNLCRQHL
jgi:hypothetical protein